MAKSDKFPPTGSLYVWGAAKMGKGALVGLILFVAVLATFWVLRGIGGLLPDNPYAALEAGRVLIG